MDLWFVDERTRRERAELEKHKPMSRVSRKTKQSVKTAAKRQRKVEKYKTKADVYANELRVRKAKEELKKKKRLAKGLPAKKPKRKKGYGSVLGVPVKKKRQARTLGKKRKITLF